MFLHKYVVHNPAYIVDHPEYVVDYPLLPQVVCLCLLSSLSAVLGRLPNIFAASIPGQENDLASPQALLKDEFYQAAFSKYHSEDAFL